jgi:hypothetical protein
MGDDGSIKSEQINVPTADESLLNEMAAVGQYDVTVESGPAYSTQRQEAADAMVQLAQGNPQIMQVAGDLVVRGLDFKGADEIAERLKLAMPPEIRDATGDEQDPQVALVTQQAKQAIDQLQQQIQAAEQGIAERDKALQDVEQRLREKEGEIQVKQYEAETKRIQALAPAVDPQLLMQVAQQAAITALQSLIPQQEPLPELMPEPMHGMAEPESQAPLSAPLNPLAG